MAIRLRTMTELEQREIERLAHARTESARAVERARILELAARGQTVPTIAHHLHLGADTVRLWIKRFNAEGLAGLTDAPRSGHPPTYTPAQVGEVIATALTKPTDLGLPFASWTLDRLEAYLNEEKGIPIKRSRIDELLIDEGLRWRTQEGWFGERATREKHDPTSANPDKPLDPEFVQKRGRSRPSTPIRRRIA